MNGRQGSPKGESSSFDDRFPTIAQWISQEGGWIEIGGDDYSTSTVRALHGGGMVWEGADDYGSLDEALTAMDAGVAAWLVENRPSGLQVKIKSPSKSPRAARQPLSTAPDVTEVTRKGKSSPASKAAKNSDRSPRGASPAVPQAVVGKVRKFVEVAAALRAGESFNITRLTSLKTLCKEPEPAQAFALFLALQARRGIEGKDVPDHYKVQIDQAITGIKSFLEHMTEGRNEHLHGLLRVMEREQNEYRSISWGQVRVVHSMEMVVVENALKSILRPNEAPFWLYQAARDYAERYDSKYGTGLIPSSAPMMQEIADFWLDYFQVEC